MSMELVAWVPPVIESVVGGAAPAPSRASTIRTAPKATGQTRRLVQFRGSVAAEVTSFAEAAAFGAAASLGVRLAERLDLRAFAAFSAPVAYATEVQPGKGNTGIEAPTWVYAYDYLVLANNKVADDVVYKLAKLMHNHKAELAANFGALRGFARPSTLAKDVPPGLEALALSCLGLAWDGKQLETTSAPSLEALAAALPK